MGYEYLVDQIVDVFLQQRDARFNGDKGPGGIIDLASWMIYISFDVIGELTYGSRHGLMESSWDSRHHRLGAGFRHLWDHRKVFHYFALERVIR